jgi:putative membrane protein
VACYSPFDAAIIADTTKAPKLWGFAGRATGVGPPARLMLRAMLKTLLRWALLAGALLLVAQLYSGVQVTTYGAALIAALVLGLLNAIVRPIFVLLTLPITLVTLGLFLFVINALMFWWAGKMLDGFETSSFWAALVGSLIYSALSLLINHLLAATDKRG